MADIQEGMLEEVKKLLASEAKVTINGVELNPSQSMTLRVAISSFVLELSDPDYLKALGPIGPGYLARAREIERLMVRG